MKVTFIFHSSFAVELMRCVLIFDYYGEGKLPKFPADKKLYFLNSHSHQDHFRRELLKLHDRYPQSEYILSNDIRLRPSEQAPWIHSVRRREEYVFGEGELRVRTLRSTDMGVAFIAEAEGKRIYHAGDLNWWHWEGEDKAWNNNMAASYKQEIDAIDGEQFDVSFVPLDPRLGDACCWGMKYFLEHVRTRAVFPMHCWEQYGVCARARKDPRIQGLLEPFYDLEHPGQEWTLC